MDSYTFVHVLVVPPNRRGLSATLMAIVLAFVVRFDSAIAQEVGAMRSESGKHLEITSDFASAERLTEFCQAFDAAVGQWESFFGFPAGTLDDWKVDAFLMDDTERFRAAGLLPYPLRFPYGYAIDGNVWVRRQASDYYMRHLLLHEGVHALVIGRFGGTGPSWYAEGMAEMLGVHRGEGSEVLVDRVPPSRDVVPYWGRFKLLSQRRDENQIPTIDAVLRYPPDLQSDVESYGWSWCAAMLFAQYPEYRQALLDAAEGGADRTRGFSEAFKRSLMKHWPIVQARWRVLTATIDYGFDWDRERVELATRDPLSDGEIRRLKVSADRGWQSAGVRFAPGTELTITATGRCSINQDPKPWVSEPAGVTIHYAGGRPLGQLLVAVVPNATEEGDRLSPLKLIPVASETQIRIEKHSWLLFRINDHLSEMSDNRGEYSVEVRPL